MHVLPRQSLGGVPLEDCLVSSKYSFVPVSGLLHACAVMLPADPAHVIRRHAVPVSWVIVPPVQLAGSDHTLVWHML
jgi:hypothetical protein